VQDRAPRFDADPDEQARVVEAFKAADEQGDLDTLAALLDEGVVVRADGGGVVTAARKPIMGRDRVLRTFAAGLRSARDVSVRSVLVNGDPGLLVRLDGQVAVLAFVVADGRITHIDIVANPEKLGGAVRL
jgi:RNA polymerase sigma-70 factor (ECF subfamily)